MEFDYRHRFLPTNNNRVEVETPLGINIAAAYEPMRRNRWVLNFPEVLNFHPWVISSVDTPTYVFSEDGNGWEDMTIKFGNPVGTPSTTVLWDLINGISDNQNLINIDEDVLSNLRDRFSDIRENGLTFNLELLDPTGVVVSKWTIHECDIKRIDFGSLDYSSDELFEHYMVVKPRNVTLHF
tara:strand:- start:484 stop:1029 length:546 start_codon:yes stop_codon:yes gene_type:complete